jgi:ferredoxin
VFFGLNGKPFVSSILVSLLSRRCPMSYIINDDCINCGACQSECPVDAISEGTEKYVIDEDKCTECGACADVCPVDAPGLP